MNTSPSGGQPRHGWFLAGLFLITLAALSVEMLDTRLLSVLTWYHLSFFAVSVAMFGMSAGAVYVYFGGDRFREDRARQSLVRASTLFALSIPLTHLANICIPLRTSMWSTTIFALGFSTLVLAVPFFLAGVVVAIALTRIPGRIGLFYAVDLLGASLGALAIIPLLEVWDITSAVIALGGVAAVGAFCFCRFARSGGIFAVFCSLALFVGAYANFNYPDYLFRLPFTKGKTIDWHLVTDEAWNVHSHIVAYNPREGQPFFWGASPKATGLKATTAKLQIDGAAGSFMTKWDGEQKSLEWVKYDVTSLPYHLKKKGDVAVIGVGGGRDILTALWGESPSVTAVEINQAFIDLLEGPMRDFARIAGRPDVQLVHDEARSYLTRVDKKFDIIQMSLIDTWAATGAGAFTLTENGLYTREAWSIFMGALKPGGLWSVTRWFTPTEVHETGRLLSLATASLLDMGVENPADHMALVACQATATLICSNEPLKKEDLATLDRLVDEYEFRIIVAPGHEAAAPLLGDIVAAKSFDALTSRIENETYDFSPPSDIRPYFFNYLKPANLFTLGLREGLGVIGKGNLMATITLLVLGVIALILVSTIILPPLMISGLPQMNAWSFLNAVLYFSGIGIGFMMIQIAFMQRFSIYLGHPTYAVAIILFSMIFFTGVGSFISDRISIETRPSWLFFLPMLVGAYVVGLIFFLQDVIDYTLPWGLQARCGVVVAIMAPLSIVLGCFFPIGMRLVKRISDDATAWMWGINGACGVLAAVIAVAVSMWAGIQVSLYVGCALYLSLIVSSRVLWSTGDRKSQVTSTDLS